MLRCNDGPGIPPRSAPARTPLLHQAAGKSTAILVASLLTDLSRVSTLKLVPNGSHLSEGKARNDRTIKPKPAESSPNITSVIHKVVGLKKWHSTR